MSADRLAADIAEHLNEGAGDGFIPPIEIRDVQDLANHLVAKGWRPSEEEA